MPLPEKKKIIIIQFLLGFCISEKTKRNKTSRNKHKILCSIEDHTTMCERLPTLLISVYYKVITHQHHRPSFSQLKMENSSVAGKEAVSFPLSWSLLSLALGIVTFQGNLLTITVFWKRRVTLKRTTYLLINLAVADLMVGFGITGFAIASIFIGDDSTKKMSLAVVATTVPSNASISSLAIVALERLFAVVRPVRHRTTKTRYYLYAVAVVWLATAFIFLLTFLSFPLLLVGGEVWYTMIAFLWASLLLICTRYLAMWWGDHIKASLSISAERADQETRQNFIHCHS